MVTDIEQIAKKIKFPVAQWPANCYSVAVAIYAAKLVPAKSRCRYGVWWGPMHSKKHFLGRGFTHHGWIELPDKRVYDPTRFVFEDAKPYIWVGDYSEGFYDVAGQRLNSAMHREFPAREKPGIKLTQKQRLTIAPFMPSVMDEDPDFGQMMWLAHYPVDQMGARAKAVLKIFTELNLEALIPLDVRRYVLEDDKLRSHELKACLA
jgi:hypothetical protein